MASKSLSLALFRFKPFAICGRPAAAPVVRNFSAARLSLAQPSGSFDPLQSIEEKDWEFDDITTAGHAELDQHREAREYARIAAYEMPLLARMSLVICSPDITHGPIADVLLGYAQPFQPPSTSHKLRFRYTTYMGEKHPSETKVVLEFTTMDLELSPVSRRKLIKLVGVRYNPEKDIVRMSCEMFETQAQNKRYLSDLMDKLLMEAKVNIP